MQYCKLNMLHTGIINGKAMPVEWEGLYIFFLIDLVCSILVGMIGKRGWRLTTPCSIVSG